MNSLETILGTSVENANHLLSDKSQYGNVYLYDHNGIRFVLKVSVLTNDKSLDDPMLPIPYQYTEKGNNFSIQKRIDLYSNFNKEAETQNNVYQNSYKKPLCPKLIDFYSIDNFDDQIAFLVKLEQISYQYAKNTIDNFLKNIYFEFEKKYKLGVIAMEYTDGYIPLSSFIGTLIENEKKEIYENIICNAIRLLNETNQIHCDLNYGNIMVKDINDILFLDFARMEQNKMEFKQNFAKKDIEDIISKIIEIDKKYQKKIDALHDNVFGTTIIDELDNLDSEKNYYANIAEKLNTFYVNNPKNNKSKEDTVNKLDIENGYISKLVKDNSKDMEKKLKYLNNFINKNREKIHKSPPKRDKSNDKRDKYSSQSSLTDRFSSLMDEFDEDTISSPNTEHTEHNGAFRFALPKNINEDSFVRLSPSPSKKRRSLFGDETPPKKIDLSHSENINPNIFSFNLGTPPRTPRGGAKKSKKTKRKPIHNKRRSKKRQNKKRVKLISNK